METIIAASTAFVKIERDLIEQSPRSKEHQLRAKDTERSAKGAERIA